MLYYIRGVKKHCDVKNYLRGNSFKREYDKILG